jgi:O-antigen/teichoic acid export membrane protein
LVRVLGTAQYGILSLAIAVIGSMALFDLGLSVALTKFVADRLATSRLDEIPGLFWGCVLLTFSLGLIAGTLMFLLVPYVMPLFNIPSRLMATGSGVFRVLALTVPFLLVTSGLQAFIAAFQRFDLLTAVKVPAGAAVFLCPLIALAFSHSLVVIVILLLVTRILAGLAYLLICFRLFPRLGAEPWTERKCIRSLTAFGGWISITNLVVAVMLYCDRFLVSGILSITAVTFYATPYDAISRLTALPVAISKAFFPAITEGFASSPERTVMLVKRGSNLILLGIGPVIFVAMVLAPLGLKLWLGPMFAAKSSGVLRWLAIGVLINSTATMPYILIQAAHRPDLVAKLHAAEVPFYLLAEFVLIKIYGIEGAAITWSARIVVDSIILWLMADQLLPGMRAIAIPVMVGTAAVAGLAAIGTLFPFSLTGQFVFLAICLAAGLSAGWLYLLTGEDRRQINSWGSEFFPSRTG